MELGSWAPSTAGMPHSSRQSLQTPAGLGGPPWPSLGHLGGSNPPFQLGSSRKTHSEARLEDIFLEANECGKANVLHSADLEQKPESPRVLFFYSSIQDLLWTCCGPSHPRPSEGEQGVSYSAHLPPSLLPAPAERSFRNSLLERPRVSTQDGTLPGFLPGLLKKEGEPGLPWISAVTVPLVRRQKQNRVPL